MNERNGCVPRLSLDWNALRRVGQAFDQSWAAIAAHYAELEVEDARTRLATIILGLAADGSWDLEQLKTASLEFFSSTRAPADFLH